MRGKCVYPGRDNRYAEDGCSPDETLYCVYWITVFHEYLAGIIFSEFVILEISRVFNLVIPKNRAG